MNVNTSKAIRSDPTDYLALSDIYTPVPFLQLNCTESGT